MQLTETLMSTAAEWRKWLQTLESSAGVEVSLVATMPERLPGELRLHLISSAFSLFTIKTRCASGSDCVSLGQVGIVRRPRGGWYRPFVRLVDLEELNLELEGRVGGLRSLASISGVPRTMTGGKPRDP